MIRTQIQLDETTYKVLKNRAHIENRSIAALIRDAVDGYLNIPQPRKLTLKDFSFIGSGRSDSKGPRPLSTKHDDALAEIYKE